MNWMLELFAPLFSLKEESFQRHGIEQLDCGFPVKGKLVLKKVTFLADTPTLSLPFVQFLLRTNTLTVSSLFSFFLYHIDGDRFPNLHR